MKILIPILLFQLVLTNALPQYRIGAAKASITPDTPIWLAGYANRTRQSEGLLHNLWVKAIVIEDSRKNRVAIVTADMIQLTHELSEDIFRRVYTDFGIDRSHILINVSHTHSGPVVWPGLSLMYNLQEGPLQTAAEYSNSLKDSIAAAIGTAIANMKEGKISTGHGEAKFALNRRQQGKEGITIGLNPSGPVDHAVPVICFTDDSGKLTAVLFGYACHNTTLNGYEICGDYAGFAQLKLEEMYPGAVAMFMTGCGADQNPEPRRTIEYAIRHGDELAGSVSGVLNGNLDPVTSSIKTSYTTTILEFPSFDPVRFRKELSDRDVYKRRRAVFLLEAYDRGYDVSHLEYPVQVMRFGKDLTLLGLAGEVVVDYSLKTKKMYPEENLFVAGYCTEVPCYIPSLRILREGGYEPDNSMVYFGLPGPFKENVEELISAAIAKVMKKAGASRPVK